MSRGRNRSGYRAALEPLLSAVRHAWKENGTLVILGLGILTIVLGCVGFQHLAAMQGADETFFDYLYQTLKLFPLNGADTIPASIWEVQIARFLAPVFTFLALLKFMSVFFAERLQQFRLRFIRHHVIVCGMNPMGLELVEDFRALNWPVVIIDPDPDSKEVETARELGAFVIEGDPAALPAQKIARIARARYLFAVTHNDSLNSEIAMTCRGFMESGGKGSAFLTCFVHIVNDELCSLLQEQQLGAGSHHFALEMFNVFQIAGQHILRECPPFPVQPAPPDCSVLIVGPGLMGETLVYDAVKLWRKTYADARKMRITMLERDAVSRANVLRRRYPALGRFCDLVPLNVDPAAPGFDYAGVLFDGGRVAVSKVYVCLEDQSIGLAIALQINRHLHEYATKSGVKKPGVQIVLRTTGEGLSRMFSQMSQSAGSFDNLYAFPLIERTCNVEHLTGGLNESIAMAIHEDYVGKQRAKGERPEKNPSVRDWDDLPETLKVSNRSQAVHIHRKIRAIGCEIARASDWEEVSFTFSGDEVEMLARMEHERFVEERESQGWKYGPVKDVDKKISPYLVPYESLTEEIKDLDRNAIRALPSVLGQADLKIIRIPAARGNEELLLRKEIAF